MQSHGKPECHMAKWLLKKQHVLLVTDSMVAKKLGYISIKLVQFTQQHNICS